MENIIKLDVTEMWCVCGTVVFQNQNDMNSEHFGYNTRRGISRIVEQKSQSIEGLCSIENVHSVTVCPRGTL
jgi:hypothetical protein